MSSNRLLFKFARRYPVKIFWTIILGFSGALFNGVSTTLIVPVIFNFLGQQVDFADTPPIIQSLIAPFNVFPEAYRPTIMVIAVVFAIILKNLATYASTLVSTSLTRNLTRDVREAGIRLLLDVDLDFYAKTQVGDLINRLGVEVNRTASAIGTAIQTVIVSITILVFVALLLSISWQLTLIATLLLGVVSLLNQYVINRAKRFGAHLSETSKAYSVRVLEALSGIRLVKVTGNEEGEYQHIQRLINNREKADFQSQMNYAAVSPINEISGIVTIILIIVLGRLFFTDQLASVSTVLFSYLLILFRLLPVIAQFNSARSKLANVSASVAVINDFLRTDNKSFMSRGNIPFKQFHDGIHFNKISFSYPGHEDAVLKDIDLYLPKGTTLALVGSSGAGKSTLADLLPRFYDPTIGSITIDGTDLRQFDLRSLRRAMGIVSQDTFLFNDSVRHNIAYARPDATEDEVVQAAKQANAFEFITRLPQGFDTVIGDRGVMLSGGQRQRIAIARALLQNPEILILDEATSALDTVSERLVQQAIDDLSSNRTTLVIAHRLSTVQKADQIAVLDKGKVVETGTHEALLRQNGSYTHLYSMQFSESAKEVFQSAYKDGLVKLSYEIRNRLNSMMGYLSLLMDDVVDSPEERKELTEEAYQSAVSFLRELETLEESTKPDV